MAQRLTKEDYRGLTPLFYSHIEPYGMLRLDMEMCASRDPLSFRTASGTSCNRGHEDRAGNDLKERWEENVTY